MRSETSRHFALAVTVGLAYLIVGVLSRTLAQAATQTMPVWLAAGVIFGALTLAARERWPAILAASIVASGIWGMAAHQLGLGQALVFAAIEVGSAAAGALLAARVGRDAESLRAVIYLICGALLTAIIGATLAAEFWAWQRPDSVYDFEWQAWAFSTAVGCLLVAPVLTTFRGFQVKRSGGMPMAQFGAGAATFAVFVIAAWIVFGPDATQRFGSMAATLTYIPMPFLVLTAILWGSRGSALAALIGALLILTLTAAGDGPFTVIDAYEGEAVIEVQAYIAMWIILVLLAGGLAASRRQALAAAQAWRLRYERTLQATGVASVEFDAVTGAATWGEAAAAVLGADIFNIGNIADWHARIDQAQRASSQAGWQAVSQGQRAASTDSYSVRLGGRSIVVQARLAAIRGPDQAVEQVAALVRLVQGDDSEAQHG